jgi:hypothetical protein
VVQRISYNQRASARERALVYPAFRSPPAQSTTRSSRQRSLKKERYFSFFPSLLRDVND